MLRRPFMIVIGIAALSALLMGGCQRTPEQRAEKLVQHLASELALNPAQTAQLEKIKDEFIAKGTTMSKDREDSLKQLNQLMTSPDIDRARLDAIVVRHQDAAKDLIRFIGDKFAEIHDMLTPEQRTKLVAMIEKHHAKHAP